MITHEPRGGVGKGMNRNSNKTSWGIGFQNDIRICVESAYMVLLIIYFSK